MFTLLMNMKRWTVLVVRNSFGTRTLSQLIPFPKSSQRPTCSCWYNHHRGNPFHHIIKQLLRIYPFPYCKSSYLILPNSQEAFSNTQDNKCRCFLHKNTRRWSHHRGNCNRFNCSGCKCRAGNEHSFRQREDLRWVLPSLFIDRSDQVSADCHIYRALLLWGLIIVANWLRRSLSLAASVRVYVVGARKSLSPFNQHRSSPQWKRKSSNRNRIWDPFQPLSD